MRKIAILLVLALLALPASALADVAKGDRGEEVRYLQWLLQQTGWLNENPDGAFGNRTEQAVMNFQTDQGLEPTGVADAALMQTLDRLRVRMDREKHCPDYYEPYGGSYTPPFDTDYTAPFHCATTALDGVVYRDSCERHLALLRQEYDLTLEGDAAGWSEAGLLWLKDIEAQYDEWAQSAPAEKRQAVRDAWEAWSLCFSAQLGAMNATWNDPALAERQLLLMLKYHAGALCELRSGELPLGPGEGLLAFEGSVAPDAHCVYWSLGVGTEFVTGCAEHAPLFARERAWVASGAEDGKALADLAADWDAALAALYDRWAALDGAAEYADNARETFQAALLALDAATEGDALSVPAYLNVVRLEAARLCELLNRG